MRRRHGSLREMPLPTKLPRVHSHCMRSPAPRRRRRSSSTSPDFLSWPGPSVLPYRSSLLHRAICRGTRRRGQRRKRASKVATNGSARDLAGDAKSAGLDASESKFRVTGEGRNAEDPAMTREGANTQLRGIASGQLRGIRPSSTVCGAEAPALGERTNLIGLARNPTPAAGRRWRESLGAYTRGGAKTRRLEPS